MNYFGIFFTFIFIPTMIVLVAAVTAYLDKQDREEI